MMDHDAEFSACTPQTIENGQFNPTCQLPFGCEVGHVRQAMVAFLDFLGFVNVQLHTRNMKRLERLLMPANFSSLVGEFLSQAIASACPTLVKNRHHNGHPDLLPTGVYPDNSALHAEQGLEIKASRYRSGWQGHNAENVWLMIFVFESNSQSEPDSSPVSFRFVSVGCGYITKQDWSISGRSATSHRTPTASVRKSGYDKIMTNWLYKA